MLGDSAVLVDLLGGGEVGRGMIGVMRRSVGLGQFLQVVGFRAQS